MGVVVLYDEEGSGDAIKRAHQRIYVLKTYIDEYYLSCQQRILPLSVSSFILL